MCDCDARLKQDNGVFTCSNCGKVVIDFNNKDEKYRKELDKARKVIRM